MNTPMPKHSACKHCGTEYKPKTWFQRFCTDACRNRAFRKAKTKRNRKKQGG